MKGLESRNAKHTALKVGLHAWSLVLAITVLVPAAYSYFYYRNRDAYLTGRFFRALSEIERQINLGLKGLDHLVDYALVEENRNIDASRCPDKDNQSSDCNQYKNYLKQYSSIFKNIEFLKSSKNCQPKHEGKESSESDVTCFEISGVVGNRKSSVFQEEGGLAAKVPLKDLIDPSPALKYFDQILLLDRAGTLIYRSGSDDLLGIDNYSARDDFSRFENLVHYLANDTIRQVDPDSFKITEKQIKRPSSHSTVRYATIGNVSYRLYIQPFHAVRQQYIANASANDRGSGTKKYERDSSDIDAIAYLVGVVADDKYFFDVISLPTGRITILIFLMLVIVLFLPHLKLLFSGPHFMPARSFYWCLVLSFPLISIVIIIGLLSANEYLKLRESVKKTAKTVAGQISKNLYREMNATINLVSNDYPFHARSLDRSEDVCFPPRKKTVYPGFEQAFYLDRNGTQVASQITFRAFPSAKVKVKRRKYFRKPRFDVESLPVWTAKRPYQPYFSERIQTYNHGLKLTAFSFPAPGRLVIKCPSSPDNGSFSVVAIVKLMQTFFHPVLPIGFGFAVVDDRTGDVLYHSNDQRSLLENFYIESDQNRELIAAIRVRRGHFSIGKYHGLAHWFWSQPLEMTPWSLIVFYNTSILELVNFKASIYSITIAGILVVFMIVVLYFGFMCVRNYDVWHWLDPLTPRVIFWALKKRRCSYTLIRLSTLYMLWIALLVLTASGLVGTMIFHAVNRDQMEAFSKVNLAHIGAQLIDRKVHLTSEARRMVVAGRDDPTRETRDGRRIEGFTYLGCNLYAFGIYADSHDPCPKNESSARSTPWSIAQWSIPPMPFRDKCTSDKKDDLVTWSSTWLSEHLPILSLADARFRLLREHHGTGRDWRFETCSASPENGIVEAQFSGNTGESIVMHGLIIPTSIVKSGISGVQWGLGGFFGVLLLYNLIKLTSERLLGLGLPSATRWRRMLKTEQSGSPFATLSFFGRSNRDSAEKNLDQIVKADAGPMLELKTILFNRARERLINTANVAPLMWLINCGVLTNRRGTIDFRDPEKREWFREQPWEREIRAYQAEEHTNIWRIMAPPFYAVLLLAFAFLILSGGKVGDFLLALIPFTLAGGLPFINQLFNKFFRE